jgi:parallel beta-helix repeat protein
VCHDLLVGLLGNPAHAVNIDSLPVVISAPGTYTMTADFEYLAGIPIVITSSDVVLDFGGHTLTGGGPTVPGIWIPPTTSNVTITNGTIDGFAPAILFESSSGSTVNGMTILHSSGGIGVLDGSGNRITGNTLIGTSFAGIGLNGSSQNLVNGNTCLDTEGYGISLVNSADGNTITDNICDDNDIAGIRLYSSNNNTFRKNEANNNGAYGFLVDNVQRERDPHEHRGQQLPRNPVGPLRLEHHRQEHDQRQRRYRDLGQLQQREHRPQQHGQRQCRQWDPRAERQRKPPPEEHRARDRHLGSQ